MERSRKRTPMIQRRKGIFATIALAVGFGCAVFGVGGATAGNGAYFRHVRAERMANKLAGLALAHRSPEQLVLAIKPKVKAHDATTPVATTEALAATTTTTTTSTAPATTTTSTTTDTTPTDTTTTTTPTTTDTTPTDTTTTTTPTTTDTTPTDTTTTTTPTTTTDTTTTDTTTTGTTTTGTTTTGTTTTGTTTSVNADSTPTGHGRQPGSTGSGSTTSDCHGRCDGVTGTTGVVPASLPSSTSSTSSNFGVSTGSVATPTFVTPTTAVNNVSSSTLPIATTTPASTPAPTSGTTTTPTITQLSDIPTFGATSAIDDLARGNGTHHSAATLPTANGGTGTTAGGGVTGAGPAGTAAAGAAAAGTGARAVVTHTRTHRTTRTSPSDGSAFTAPFSSGVRVIDNVVKVIPTAVWIALGAAFALMLAFAAIAFRSSRRARRREKEFAAISAAALTDALTGILNRRGFTEAAERELARASRYHRPFVLAYVDVRGLKTVNDTEGHLMGDELIKTVAGLMKESARADDVVGRIGGDEFALLLAEQTAESAAPVIRRIQARVAEARAEMEISAPWELTIGMASFPDDGETLEELLNTADRRLYEQRGIALR